MATAGINTAQPAAAADGGLLAAGAMWAAVALALACVLAKVLNMPVARDEQMFFAVSMLARDHDIYRELGFNHLPNLPLFAGPLLHIADRPFLVARLIVVGAWVATALLLVHASLKETGMRKMAAVAVLLLASSPLMINETGTLFSNNLLPVPFALAGVLLFLRALENGARPRPALILLAGVLLAVAAGFKGNFVFVIVPVGLASLLVPRELGWMQRLTKVTLPLLVGGIAGGLPTLLHLANDPTGLLAHVVGYHTGPHRAHALQSTEPLVVSLGERLILARQMWGDGGTILCGFACVLLAALLLRRGWRPDWPVMLVAALIALGSLMGLVPTPSFPQYFSLPLPFLILLLLLLVGHLRPTDREILNPVLLALAVTVLLIDGPRLVRDVPRLASPSAWVPMKVAAVSRQIVAATGDGPVATLSPIYVLEAGGRIYPELAAGPFVYRVADLIPADQRPHYARIVGPRELDALLDSRPPAGILVGEHGPLEDSFRTWAQDNRMKQVELEKPGTRYGELTLFVTEPASRAQSQPAT